MFNTPGIPPEKVPPPSLFHRYRKWLLVALLGTVALVAVASYERKSKASRDPYVYANYLRVGHK